MILLLLLFVSMHAAALCEYYKENKFMLLCVVCYMRRVQYFCIKCVCVCVCGWLLVGGGSGGDGLSMLALKHHNGSVLHANIMGAARRRQQ